MSSQPDEIESERRCSEEIDRIFRNRIDQLRQQIALDLFELESRESRTSVINALVVQLIAKNLFSKGAT